MEAEFNCQLKKFPDSSVSSLIQAGWSTESTSGQQFKYSFHHSHVLHCVADHIFLKCPVSLNQSSDYATS